MQWYFHMLNGYGDFQVVASRTCLRLWWPTETCWYDPRSRPEPVCSDDSFAILYVAALTCTAWLISVDVCGIVISNIRKCPVTSSPTCSWRTRISVQNLWFLLLDKCIIKCLMEMCMHNDVLYKLQVHIGSDNGMVPHSDRPISEHMMIIWCVLNQPILSTWFIWFNWFGCE